MIGEGDALPCLDGARVLLRPLPLLVPLSLSITVLSTHICAFIPAPAPRVVSSSHLCPDSFLKAVLAVSADSFKACGVVWGSGGHVCYVHVRTHRMEV